MESNLVNLDFDFEAPAGTRILGRDGLGIAVRGLTVDKDLWWDHELRKWIPLSDPGGRKGSSNHAPCESFKAFRRHIRRHYESLRGHKVIFISRWVDHNVSVHIPM